MLRACRDNKSTVEEINPSTPRAVDLFSASRDNKYKAESIIGLEGQVLTDSSGTSTSSSK